LDLLSLSRYPSLSRVNQNRDYQLVERQVIVESEGVEEWGIPDAFGNLASHSYSCFVRGLDKVTSGIIVGKVQRPSPRPPRLKFDFQLKQKIQTPAVTILGDDDADDSTPIEKLLENPRRIEKQTR
jgi:hypothetical protein